MVTSRYSWKNGVELEEHTRRKHKILREYLERYLTVRCVLPQQTKFRLAIVEGFAGGGRYKKGEPGSPLIFLTELRAAAEAFNLRRKSEGMADLDIECFFLLNDEDPEAISLLRNAFEPLLAAIKVEVPKLHVQREYFSQSFEAVYPEMKALLERGRYRSVLFNLDQYGYSDVRHETLKDITASFSSVEIFYTFSVESLLAFLRKSNPGILVKQLGFLGVTAADISPLENQMSKKEWLGAAEQIIFDTFKNCAQFVSTFSINNPEGWRYWLIHFANSYRARQEYNNVLHNNSSMQAHYGRSGLNMLSFDPEHDDAALYLFDISGRTRAKQQLIEDIPRGVTEYGDAVNVGQFYNSIYNMTPAHADEIHSAMIENPDIEVITETGTPRRRANTISPEDILRMKRQISMFPMFLNPKK
jgi:three-Cys-motif partner protein